MVRAPVISLRAGDVAAGMVDGNVAAGMVDDWGRDPGLVATVTRLANLRWDVSVGGSQYLPRRKGALVVVNARRLRVVADLRAGSPSRAQRSCATSSATSSSPFPRAPRSWSWPSSPSSSSG